MFRRVSLALVPSYSYNARGAGAGEATKRGFFGISVLFHEKREKRFL
jgi:hypothetical protein